MSRSRFSTTSEVGQFLVRIAGQAGELYEDNLTIAAYGFLSDRLGRNDRHEVADDPSAKTSRSDPALIYRGALA